MSLYPASSLQALHARQLLKDWAAQGLITPPQYERLDHEITGETEQQTVSNLRTTNFFFRIILFFFTALAVLAAVILFLRVFLIGSSDETTGFFFLISAAATYAAAEAAASRACLYRHGIEEALAACSVGLLCAGIEPLFFLIGRPYSPRLESLVPAAGGLFSLWIWRRFGLWYAFLAAMIFVIFLPGYWTTSPSAEHTIVAAIYALGLLSIIAIRNVEQKKVEQENGIAIPAGMDGLDNNSPAEAMLWLGLYLLLNLKLSSIDSLPWWNRGFSAATATQFSSPFYWTTWVLIWCLPAVILARGIGLWGWRLGAQEEDQKGDQEESPNKDRLIIAAGAIAAVLTFISNKPYLGWPRHTWDPMLLGILLTAVAVFLRRWLDRGPGGIRHGFTAARLTGKDKLWIDAGSAVLGLVTPQSITPAPQPTGPDFRFGGGQTGGGGAGGDFR